MIRKRGTGLGKVAAAVEAGCVPVLVSVTGGSDNRKRHGWAWRGESLSEPASSSAWSNRISPRKFSYWVGLGFCRRVISQI